MARASNIYIVVEPDYDGVHIIATFTVKHECKTWLQRNPSEPHASLRYVTRYPDGGADVKDAPMWSEEDFLAGPPRGR